MPSLSLEQLLLLHGALCKPVNLRTDSENGIVASDDLEVIEILGSSMDPITVIRAKIDELRQPDANGTLETELSVLRTKVEDQLGMIAEKYDVPVGSLSKKVTVPYLHGNKRKRTKLTQFLSTRYTDAGMSARSKIAEYNALSDEELQALQEDADLVNLQRSVNGPNYTNSLRDIYTQLCKSLDRNFNMLKQMCGLDAICFVVPKKLGGYVPEIFLHGSERALPFYALMEKNEVLISGRTMVERFKMNCYEQTEKEEKEAGIAAKVPVSSAPLLAPVSSAASALVSVPVSQGQRSYMAKKRDLENKILARVTGLYNALDQSQAPRKKFPWNLVHQGKVKLEGWPEGVPKMTPSAWPAPSVEYGDLRQEIFALLESNQIVITSCVDSQE
ncbi:hypothetical protein BJV82DRAFT_672755 [Fennellomyces sp. T-0311]|nr:hypothetical protein BJV82DRAFT_672755 [Fennellomyces sp. T-0311]